MKEIKRVRKRRGGGVDGDRQEMGDRENRLRYREDSDIHRQIRQTGGKTQTEVADNETVTDRIRHRQTDRQTDRQEMGDGKKDGQTQRATEKGHRGETTKIDTERQRWKADTERQTER